MLDAIEIKDEKHTAKNFLETPKHRVRMATRRKSVPSKIAPPQSNPCFSKNTWTMTTTQILDATSDVLQTISDARHKMLRNNSSSTEERMESNNATASPSAWKAKNICA
mmetsp:Transcript_103742/g.203445  ORF Transcript_103742/g.203445 Transcript_103742/m.203445 type:complete len:109 (-) Transcript_103742:695-1021(-)